MKLLIKTDNPVLTTVYNNHQHYNPGDSGLENSLDKKKKEKLN